MKIFIVLLSLCAVRSSAFVAPTTRWGTISYPTNNVATPSIVGSEAVDRHFRHYSFGSLFMFGNLFGGDDKKENDELAVFSKLASDSDDKYQALADYVEKWSKLFETGGIKLTTPVKVVAAEPEIDEDSDVVAASGVCLLFQSTNTGYMSKAEEDAAEQGEPEEAPKKEEKKQGGVEVLVEKLESGEIRMRAQRCNMDEDTMIKEMSEDAIVTELMKAVDVWKQL